MKGWYVVKFPDKNDSIEVIPANWIDKVHSTCLWPPYTKVKLQEAIKSQEKSDSTWTAHNIRLVSKKLFENFSPATTRATKARYTSDVSSAESIPSKIRRVKASRSYSSCSSATSDLDNIVEFPYIPMKQQSKNNRTSSSKRSICPSLAVSTPTTRTMDSLHQSETPSVPLSTPKNSTSASSDTYRRHDVESETDSFQRQVLHQLVSINFMLKKQSETLDKILNYVEQREVQKESDANKQNYEEFLQKFPLAFDDQLEDVEDSLNNGDYFNILVSAMARVGGDNTSAIVRRIMGKLLNDEIAVLYSWKGHKGKKVFSKLRLAAVVLEAVKRNRRIESTDKDIEMVAAKWLSKALERTKRKK